MHLYYPKHQYPFPRNQKPTLDITELKTVPMELNYTTAQTAIILKLYHYKLTSRYLLS